MGPQRDTAVRHVTKPADDSDRRSRKADSLPEKLARLCPVITTKTAAPPQCG
jgi:hypothetical protein